MDYFSIAKIAVELPGYPVSYVELVATLTGLLSVWLATRQNVWTWPLGIVNELGFFLIFYQVQLYADMLLQVYFFVVTLYSWYYWRRMRRETAVLRSSSQYRQTLLVMLFGASAILGFMVARLHLWLPAVFTAAASYPYLGAFVTVASVLAMWLMAQKRIECWWLWIMVDVLSIYLYLNRAVLLIALEYGVFLALAGYGLWQWRRRLA